MKIDIALKEAQTFEKLCPLAEKAEPKVSFWGAVYVTVEGNEGYVGIHAITKRVFDLIAKNHEFDEIERSFGKRITARVEYIYDKSDEIVQTCNFFTKILLFLRNFSLSGSERTYWRLFERNLIFESYTESQFQKVFGYSIKEARKSGIQMVDLAYDMGRWRILPKDAQQENVCNEIPSPPIKIVLKD